MISRANKTETRFIWVIFGILIGIFMSPEAHCGLPQEFADYVDAVYVGMPSGPDSNEYPFYVTFKSLYSISDESDAKRDVNTYANQLMADLTLSERSRDRLMHQLQAAKDQALARKRVRDLVADQLPKQMTMTSGLTVWGVLKGAPSGFSGSLHQQAVSMSRSSGGSTTYVNFSSFPLTQSDSPNLIVTIGEGWNTQGHTLELWKTEPMPILGKEPTYPTSEVTTADELSRYFKDSDAYYALKKAYLKRHPDKKVTGDEMCKYVGTKVASYTGGRFREEIQRGLVSGAITLKPLPDFRMVRYVHSSGLRYVIVDTSSIVADDEHLSVIDRAEDGTISMRTSALEGARPSQCMCGSTFSANFEIGSISIDGQCNAPGNPGKLKLKGEDHPQSLTAVPLPADRSAHDEFLRAIGYPVQTEVAIPNPFH